MDGRKPRINGESKAIEKYLSQKHTHIHSQEKEKVKK